MAQFPQRRVRERPVRADDIGVAVRVHWHPADSRLVERFHPVERFRFPLWQVERCIGYEGHRQMHSGTRRVYDYLISPHCLTRAQPCRLSSAISVGTVATPSSRSATRLSTVHVVAKCSEPNSLHICWLGLRAGLIGHLNGARAVGARMHRRQGERTRRLRSPKTSVALVQGTPRLFNRCKTICAKFVLSGVLQR